MSILDPCHPLFGQTFPLLHLRNTKKLVRCCLVRLPTGAERLIPVRVTNLADSQLATFPLPVDLSSLHTLTQTFSRIAKEYGDDGKREAFS